MLFSERAGCEEAKESRGRQVGGGLQKFDHKPGQGLRLEELKD